MNLVKNISSNIDRACKSVVRVYTRTNVGAGVIVSKDNLIITNYHVITGGNRIKVETIEGKIFNAFLIVKLERFDIAFLFVVDPMINYGTVPIKIENKQNYKVGDTVFAIGHPAGLDHTVNRGIVSAVERKITSGNYPTKIFGLRWIQTDTPLTGGHSGGPLINEWGEMIGLNTWIRSTKQDNDGINFSLPAFYFLPWIQYLHEYFNPKKKMDKILCTVCGSFSSSVNYYCATCGVKLYFDIRRKDLLHKLKKVPFA